MSNPLKNERHNGLNEMKRQYIIKMIITLSFVLSCTINTISEKAGAAEAVINNFDSDSNISSYIKIDAKNQDSVHKYLDTGYQDTGKSLMLDFNLSNIDKFSIKIINNNIHDMLEAISFYAKADNDWLISFVLNVNNELFIYDIKLGKTWNKFLITYDKFTTKSGKSLSSVQDKGWLYLLYSLDKNINGNSNLGSSGKLWIDDIKFIDINDSESNSVSEPIKQSFPDYISSSNNSKTAVSNKESKQSNGGSNILYSEINKNTSDSKINSNLKSKSSDIKTTKKADINIKSFVSDIIIDNSLRSIYYSESKSVSELLSLLILPEGFTSAIEKPDLSIASGNEKIDIKMKLRLMDNKNNIIYYSLIQKSESALEEIKNREEISYNRALPIVAILCITFCILVFFLFRKPLNSKQSNK